MRCDEQRSGVPRMRCDGRVVAGTCRGQRTVEEQHQFLAERVRIACPCGVRGAHEPVPQRTLVPCGDRSGENDRRTILADGIGQRAPAKAFGAELRAQRVEHRLDAGGVFDERAAGDVAPAKVLGDQRFFRGEVIVERSARDVGRSGDGLQTRRRDAVFVEERVGGAQNCPPRRYDVPLAAASRTRPRSSGPV